MLNLIKFNQLNHLIKDTLHLTTKCISTSSIQFKHGEFKQWSRTLQYREEGVQGISLVGVENEIETRFLQKVDFPSLGLEDLQFEDGLKYSDLPILDMITHKNNTRLACFDHLYSKIIDYASAGTEGFKKCKKGTTVAAHAAGYAIGKKIQLKGHRQVRLAIRGIGSGRKAAIQGMVQSGLKIISITDITNYNPYPTRRAPRPLKR